MNIINKLLKNLNPQQRKSVTTTEGYIRVIAGAGSGKTRALTTRYAYIVEALGISASHILCVTFTNKAAREMRNRVKKLIGGNQDLAYITTYHGFCVRVLREDINKLMYPQNFIILDVEDQKTILRDVFNELGLTSQDFSFKYVLSDISFRKSSQEYLEYVLESKAQEGDEMLDKIFFRYLEKQQRNYALDFDDLLNFTLYIYENHDDVLEKWQKRLHYIQVDETQDSSPLQFLLVEMLSAYHGNLFVVGDPDQTIYEWRGAKPELLVDFDKRFPAAKTIIMNQNYRSTPNILNIGNQIIKNNTVRVDKDMFTQNPSGVDVVHFHARSDKEEADWIAQEIKRLVKVEGASFSAFAVLYRANYLSRSIEQSLIREKIPYSVYGGIRFFERKEIKDVLAYIRLIEFGDDFSFLRIVNRPSRRLGKKWLEKVAAFAERQDKSLYNALKDNLTDDYIGRKGAYDFVALIEKYRKVKDKMQISDLIKAVLDEGGLAAYYRQDGDSGRLENLKELQNSIILLENEYEDERLELAEYLQEIALYTDRDVEDESVERVKLMTIHTSKGLEFPYVFLCGFTDGVLPSARSIKERRAKAIEEERRLTYVAITRAEKAFYMTESEGFNFRTGMSKYPSRFLFEISENFFVRKGELSQELINEAREQIALNSGEEPVKQGFHVGDIVNHPVWQNGKVLEVDEDKGVYEIKFDQSGKVKPINFDYKFLDLVEESPRQREEERN